MQSNTPTIQPNNKPTSKALDELIMPETSQSHPWLPRALPTPQLFKDQVEKKKTNQDKDVMEAQNFTVKPQIQADKLTLAPRNRCGYFSLISNFNSPRFLTLQMVFQMNFNMGNDSLPQFLLLEVYNIYWSFLVR